MTLSDAKFFLEFAYHAFSTGQGSSSAWVRAKEIYDQYKHDPEIAIYDFLFKNWKDDFA